MIWDAIDFICRETTLQLKRERLIAIATVSTVAVLLTLLGAIVLFHVNLRLWTKRAGDELDVWVYFSQDVPREQARKQTGEVADWPEVRTARFVPKEEGLKDLQTWFPSTSALSTTDNPLPDAARVGARDPELLLALVRRLEGLSGVKDVVPKSELAESTAGPIAWVIQAKRMVSWGGIAIGFLVAFAGVLIVNNTIRLALHARRRDIYIMQLVGAARGAITAPFLLEGAIHGLLGAILACCLLVPAHMYLRSLVARAAPLGPLFFLAPDQILLPFGLYLLLAGVLLGVFGSALSVRRFLRRRIEWEG